ncbi:unnamed protein product [Linum tenue]|uniref:Uncharacterized protein n=1 Tax=Linum tenue TaxID=586396 RepID=A0AAV0PXQ8_9ROSI|nr:unnamed protein product [Linum tenue]
MKGREIKGAPSTADLLVCFPSRAHLTLMPKPICSPARGSEPNKQRGHHHRTPSAGAGVANYQHRLKKKGSVGRGSPMLWGKTKQQMGSGDNLVSEPTSPKVTCAGQIKVRHHHHKASANCKNWQSVMEEIERLHNHRKQTTTSSWAESLGFKKEVMHFLTCLRSIRFDLRCFGSFPQSDINSDDDDEDEEEDDAIDGNEEGAGAASSENSRAVFSKWFMVLQENKGNDCEDGGEKEKEEEEEAAVPPANALLLMRCRSAPAKSWMEQKQEEEEAEDQKQKEEEKEEEEGAEEKRGKNLKTLMEEERKTEMEKLIVMRYDTDFYKISCDVAKETWVVGGGMMNMTDPFSRSRSWKR